MSGLNDLSRASLLEHKRAGLTDIDIAKMCDSAPDAIFALRMQFGIPALAVDLHIDKPSRAMDGRGRKKKKVVPLPQHRTGSVAMEWHESMRTTDKAEAYFANFFATHPNFGADDVPVRPMARMSASMIKPSGTQASPLSDFH